LRRLAIKFLTIRPSVEKNEKKYIVGIEKIKHHEPTQQISCNLKNYNQIELKGLN